MVLLDTRDDGQMSTSEPRTAPAAARRVALPGADGPAAMRVAVREAASLATAGDTVLLAPAAASLDMFADYAQRGRAFAAAVEELRGGGTGQ